MSKDPRFEAHLAAELDAPAATPLDDGVFRIAILGDFSGRPSPRAGDSGEPVSRRRAWRVDRDDVDTVLSQIAPRLRLTIDPSAAPVAVQFAAIDDFHPDQLLARVAIFQQLQALRSGAQASPAPAAPPKPGSPPRTDSLALGLSSGSLLDRIVDGDSEPIRGVAPADELAEFVDRAVRPHAVRETSREQRELTAKVDDVVEATMRVLLHHPDFQALEALWRGVDFFVRRLDTSETLQVVLVDVSRSELVVDLGAGADASTTAVGALFETGSLRGTSLVVGAYSFGPDDVPLLRGLSTVGRMAGAPWIVGADPRLAGATSFAGEADPDDWDAALPPDWEALRRSPSAPFLGLALPRFILREPYGQRTDACDFPFEEMPAGRPDHESYLWGNSALLCALAIGESVSAGETPATHATIERLPLHVVTVDGAPAATPVVEAVITHDAVAHMLDRGLTPLASPRDGDTALISRLQSVAFPPRALSISTGFTA